MVEWLGGMWFDGLLIVRLLRCAMDVMDGCGGDKFVVDDDGWLWVRFYGLMI